MRDELKDIAKLILSAVAIVAVIGFVAFYRVRESWEDREARIQARREACEARREELKAQRIYCYGLWGNRYKVIGWTEETWQGFRDHWEVTDPSDYMGKGDLRLMLVRNGLGQIVEDYRTRENVRTRFLSRSGGKRRKMATVM